MASQQRKNVRNVMLKQYELLDNNLYSVISKCFINSKRPGLSEIFVIYSDGYRERIWTYNNLRYDFDHRDFIGKTKLEAVFYCDRKPPIVF